MKKNDCLNEDTVTQVFGERSKAGFANDSLKILATCWLRSVFRSGILLVTRFQSTSSSRTIPVVIKDIFVYVFVETFL